MLLDLEDLIEQYNDKIPYELLLNTKEWSVKRKSIIERDKNVCQKCGIEGPHDYKMAIKNGFIKEVGIRYEEKIAKVKYYK